MGRNATTLGLYYYGARWYDSALGHFIQPDSIVPGAGNPLAWDRYAYTLNNPVKYVDPSGHDAYWCTTAQCKTEHYRKLGYAMKSSPYRATSTPDAQGTAEAYWGEGNSYNNSKPTATPQTSLNPGPSPAPTFPTQINPANQGSTSSISFDPSKVDWIDFVIDIVGITSDVTLTFVPEGPGEIVEGIGTSIELTGAGKSIYEAMDGNVNASREALVSQVVDTVASSPEIQSRLGRAVPVLGSFISGYSIYENLAPAFSTEP